MDEDIDYEDDNRTTAFMLKSLIEWRATALRCTASCVTPDDHEELFLILMSIDRFKGRFEDLSRLAGPADLLKTLLLIKRVEKFGLRLCGEG